MFALDSEKIKSLLPERHKGVEIIVFDSIDSTNTQAKRTFRKDGKDMLIVAETQTAGRGRQGKSFYSPEKTGVYMSLVIHNRLPLALASKATTATAVAVCEAIEDLTDKQPEIKWVNDIFLNKKKICGILTEAIPSDRNDITDALVIGIGINVSTCFFPDEIKDIAGSLDTKELDRNKLAANIAQRVFDYIKHPENPKLIEDYTKRCFVMGKEISYKVNGEKFFATAVGIDENGGLIVKDKSGKTTALQSGEISIKL